MNRLCGYSLSLLIVTLMLCSCSRQENSPEPQNAQETNQRSQNIQKVHILQDIALTSEQLDRPFIIETIEYKGRDSLNFLKRPRADVNVLRQTLTDADNGDEAFSITLMLFQFPTEEAAQEETKVNLAILEGLTKKEEFSVKEFETNMIGDISMGISFTGKTFPFYLYFQHGKYLIKLNAGNKCHMKDLINIARLINAKLS